MRVPDGQKWNKGSAQAVRLAPYKLHEAKEPEAVFQERMPDEAGVADQPVRPTMARRVHLKPKAFEDLGRTARCPRCDHELRYCRDNATSRPHSEACRRRICEELENTAS